MSSLSTASRLVHLWCPACKEQTPHRVSSVGIPRCLSCEEREGVNIPPPPDSEKLKSVYPAR